MPLPGVIAIDVGTSSTKACFTNELGEVESLHHVNYEYETHKSGFYEQDPTVWWDAVCSCIKLVLADVSKNLVKSISVTGQYPSLFPVDRSYNPLRKAILWLDSRAESQASEIKEGLGVNIGSAWPIPKIMWVRDNESAIHEQAYKYLQVMDFIRLKLTGECITDWTSAWALSYDTEHQDFKNDILEFAGLSSNLFPKVLGPMDFCGNVSEQASQKTGLNPGTPVITGGNDISMAAVGSNAYNENFVFDVTGSSTFIGTIITDRVYAFPFGLFVTNGVLRKTNMIGCVINSTGSILEWLRKKIFSFGNEKSSFQKEEFYKFINQESHYADFSIDDPMMIPYFTGILSPHVDNTIRGSIHNLSFHNDFLDIVKSVFESTAFALKWNLEYIKNISPKIDRIIVSGGGSKSDVWCQIKADITGFVVSRMKNSESSLLGASMVAAIGAGMFPDIGCCSEKFFTIERDFLPSNTDSEIINARYSKFKHLLS
jgi:xylulokinase